MRKIIYLFALSLIFACNDDLSNSLETNPESLKVELNNSSISIVTFDGKSSSMKSSNLNLESIREKYSKLLYAKSENTSNKNEFSPSHSSGHFTTLEGNTITFGSGNNGKNGKWVSIGVANYKGDVVCNNIVGNQAIVQVAITEVGDGLNGILVGDSVLFFVKDNGEGRNAEVDEYFPWVLVFSGFPFSLCNLYDFGAGPEEGLSPEVFLNIMVGIFGHPNSDMSDTLYKSDQIQIK
ncbi:hypothetical protein OE09_1042 [Flavobacteriaceae bacterium MAR_2010_72]|nr:hypothetical protein OE09_1042 [Flavobacteriaceae bacterium MAR_2010_72]TVZ60156.1 hypothetical protein NA63_2706 [Flavobacteriaceae bacterium MAR_2010_105]